MTTKAWMGRNSQNRDLSKMRADLATRYGEERLPRYTSYPTAPHFSPTISSKTYGQWLEMLPPDSVGSLYLHIPFCQTMCWYCGCNTTVNSRQATIDGYLAALYKEIDLVTTRIARPLSISHLHLGGGTPTIITPAQFDGLTSLLRTRFIVVTDAEMAIEIDPRTLTSDMIRALGANGVTRASLGVQSFDTAVQHAINRVQSFEETAAATDGLRAAGIRGVNFDLIYGLPNQTVTSCLETVSQCLELRPDRFSVFGYAHVPTFKKHQRKINEATLPGSTARLDQSTAIAQALTDAGYLQIGMDHFVLPTDSMAIAQQSGTLRRNFQGYTTDTSDTLIGLGISSIGRLAQGYVQNDIVIRDYSERVLNDDLATIKGYALTADDQLRAEIIERLMCDFEVDLQDICFRHHVSPEAVLQSASRLPALEADGVIHVDGTNVRIAEPTRYLVRSVASAFDSHLAPAARLHSRAV